MAARPAAGDDGGFPGNLLRRRWMLYVAVLVVLVLARAIPGLWPETRVLPRAEKTEKILTLTGLDLAPSLIPRLAEEYRRLYPEVAFRLNRGGTRHALEDLLNLRADVAFLGRLPTDDEEAVVRSVVDTTWSFPIALGGIAILVPESATIDSLHVDELRALLAGGTLPERFVSAAFCAYADGRPHIYAPDPNLGLWTALVGQIGLPDTAGASVFWCEDDASVAAAVGRDACAMGIASTLAVSSESRPRGLKAVRLAGEARPGAMPSDMALAAGDYPLFHYLYIACRPDCGAAVSGFVSFLFSGRGQRLVAREGFLPARDMPREIQLTSRPVGKIG